MKATFNDMKELPHLVKPASLILIILQTIFVFAPGYRGFGWFVIMTTIIQLMVVVFVFLGLVADMGLVRTSMWSVMEIAYSGAFAFFQAITFFYFIVNLFGHFNFWLLLGVITSALLCLVWLFNAFQWWRARTPPPPSQPSTAPPPPYTPSYPAGVNPA